MRTMNPMAGLFRSLRYLSLRDTRDTGLAKEQMRDDPDAGRTEQQEQERE